MGDETRRRFGERWTEQDTSEVPEQPVPVLHVGEVHAELRLHVTDDTLRDLGSQIASMLAAATRQGFEHGLAAAMDPAAGPAEFQAGAAAMSDADRARARGQVR